MVILRKDELEVKLAEDSILVKNGVLRDDSPLDTSAEFCDFLLACRLGDLRRCQEHINGGVNINGKDTFDYTPLIIASLCGHYELVQLLLEAGALAERNTFQGERCIYNALNDRIRNLLLQYDFSKSSDPNIYWATHISTLLGRTAPRTSDISLDTGLGGDSGGGVGSLQLHKFLLASRTPYFREKLRTQPDTASWRLSASIPVEAFHIAVRYIYLGDVPRDLVPPGSPVSEEEVARGLDKISKLLEIEHLWEAILAGNDRRLARQRSQDEVERALRQVGEFFRENVIGHKIVVDTSRVDQVRWRLGNSMFADVLLRADEPLDEDADEDDAEEEEEDMLHSGLGIPNGDARRASTHEKTNGADHARVPTTTKQSVKAKPTTTTRTKTRKSVLYPAHKAMLIRSEYFEKMFSGDFLESRTGEQLHVVTVDCTPAVLELVLTFLYTEAAAPPLEHALDLLYAADMLFLDGLKSKAAVAISTLGSASRVQPQSTDSHFNSHSKPNPHSDTIPLSNPQPHSGSQSTSYPQPHSNSQPNSNTNSRFNSQSTLQPQPQSQSPPKSQSQPDPQPPLVEPINIYDVVHAAWDLRVQRLEEFAARYLAARLEHYIDDPDFHDLIRESAARIRDRQETDTIELLDDIRYYLSERFRLRFEDAGLEQIMEEEAAPTTPSHETTTAATSPPTTAISLDTTTTATTSPPASSTSPPTGPTTSPRSTTIATAEKEKEVPPLPPNNAPNAPHTDGSAHDIPNGHPNGPETRATDDDVDDDDDEFLSDALNYQVLLEKIDVMLERLKLDA